MKLSKTALRELSAKYRAVLMKCALMNMMIFAGALMPQTANAYLNFNDTTIIVDNNSTLDTSRSVNEIAFNASEQYVLDGANNSLSAVDNGPFDVRTNLRRVSQVGGTRHGCQYLHG